VKVLIVGNGVAGVTAAQAIVRADPHAQVHIFGAELYPYYYRPRLWEFIAGQIDQSALYFRPPAWYAERGIQLHLGEQVTALDPLAHHVTLADGARVGYDRLLLATGGRSFVPPFDGVGKKGVFTLRTLEDALAIKGHAQNVSSAAVIGGGLLGLETARALLSLGLEVSVIEFVPHLLPRQLDREGAQVLQSRLEAMGLRILTGVATEAILGDERATGVRLKGGEHGQQDGRVIDGELVLISTGIRSRVELAQKAGLEVNRGVVVDAQLCTSAADVYAAGDVAEFEGIVYGIIPAAIEQARIAAANMVAGSSTTPRQDSGCGGTTYDGTVPATTLKIVGIDLTCLGEATADGAEFVVLRRVDPATGTYRRLALRENKIVGAILLGDTQNAQSLKKLIATRRDVSALSVGQYGALSERLLDESFDLKTLETLAQ
jgi:nitrite reductase (NADH) large subunit